MLVATAPMLPAASGQLLPEPPPAAQPSPPASQPASSRPADSSASPDPADLPPLYTVPISAGSVSSVDESRRIISVRFDGSADLELHQPIVVTASGAPISLGESFAHTRDRAAFRPTWSDVMPSAGLRAIALPVDLAARMRPILPESCSLWTRVIDVESDHRRCRLDPRIAASLRPHDALVIVRAGFPIARADVVEVLADAVTADLSPLVANATPRAGDLGRLEQTDTARRTGRLRSRILKAAPRGAEQEVWFPLRESDGAAPGDRWEIRRKGEYVGLAELRAFRPPFAIGTALAAFARTPAAPGDDVIRRTRQDVASGEAALRIFRIEDDYCLVNAGESDDILRGQSLVVLREGKPIATLTVTTVKVDYCGAAIHVDPGQERAPDLRVGEIVRSRIPVGRAVAIGRTTNVRADGRLVTIALDDAAHAPPDGSVVELASATRAIGAVALTTSDRTTTAYVPPECADADVETGMIVRLRRR